MGTQGRLWKAVIFVVCACAAIVLLSSLGPRRSAASASKLRFDVGALQAQTSAAHPIQPLQPVACDAEVVALGRRLFHDERLSADGTISCASCHVLSLGGVDGTKRSVGMNGSLTTVNTPTVLNSGMSFRQFWDGRAKTLEEQVDGPLLDSEEMGTTWPELLAALHGDPQYVSAFDRLYADGITKDNVRRAIADFERSLVTLGSPFDRYLGGDADAISDMAQHGYALFKRYGCISCHQGQGIGGNMFQRFGIMGDYFADRGAITTADLGRYNVTGDERDKHVFKVPSLRNVALTAPYFHDGEAETIEDAVQIMARYQLGQPIPDSDVTALVEFLNTLTGDLPEGDG